MTNEPTNSSEPYRSPTEVSDAPRRSFFSPIIVAVILLFVLAGVASAMFFSISAPSAPKVDASMEEYVTQLEWRSGPAPEEKFEQ